VFEVDEDGTVAVRTASPAAVATTVPSGGGSLAGYTVLARGVVVVEDAATERRFDTGSLAPDTRSAVAAPVLGPGGVRGALTVESNGLRSFDKAATDFVHSMANVVGAALKERRVARAAGSARVSARPGSR
jgi:GAF domain-containing protein